ncbi:haloacid dehalogenase type II [Lentibacillus lipolyticus]|nr:haloacid dehalogenase type II [Lentibacillus lipolyticus]
MAQKPIRAVLFDVFGTVVDYRESIIREGKRWNRQKGININWPSLADDWRSAYQPAINRILNGEKDWKPLDVLHREELDHLASRYDLSCFTEEELREINRVWHRLEPWGDSVTGLEKLKRHFIIAPLSNGNVALLTNMAKNSRLPWDLILSPEFIKSYKPDPAVYQMAYQFLGLEPDEVVMAAAHPSDLQAAAALGMKTAYICRPLEHGGHNITAAAASEENCDYNARDIVDLANQLIETQVMSTKRDELG